MCEPFTVTLRIPGNLVKANTQFFFEYSRMFTSTHALIHYTREMGGIRHCLQFSGSFQSFPVLVRGSTVSSVEPWGYTQGHSLVITQLKVLFFTIMVCFLKFMSLMVKFWWRSLKFRFDPDVHWLFFCLLALMTINSNKCASSADCSK